AAKPRFVGGPPVKRSSTPPPVAAKPSATPAEAGPIPPAVKTSASPSPASATNGKKSAPAEPDARPAAPPSSETNLKQTPAAKQSISAGPRRHLPLMAGSVAVGMLVVFIAISAVIHFLRPANVGRPLPPRPAKFPSAATRPASIPSQTQ